MNKKLLGILVIISIIITTVLVFLFIRNNQPPKPTFLNSSVLMETLPEYLNIDTDTREKVIEIYDKEFENHKSIDKIIEEKIFNDEQNKIALENEINLNDEEKKICTKNTQQMNDDQLLYELKNSNNSLYEKRKLHFNKYFSCKIDDVNYYNRAEEIENYISQNNINNNNKNYLSSIEDYKYRDHYDSLFLMYTFATNETLCLPSLKEHCYSEYLINRNNTIPFICRDMCNKVTNLINNEDYINAILTDFVWLDPSEFYLLKHYIYRKLPIELRFFRVSFLYRFAGKEKVYEMCDNFTGEDKQYCTNFIELRIDILEGYENYKKECREIQNNLADFVCQ